MNRYMSLLLPGRTLHLNVLLATRKFRNTGNKAGALLWFALLEKNAERSKPGNARRSSLMHDRYTMYVYTHVYVLTKPCVNVHAYTYTCTPVCPYIHLYKKWMCIYVHEKVMVSPDEPNTYTCMSILACHVMWSAHVF